jgi:AraC-like DNA-binding protein
MKGKSNPNPKRNEVNIASTPLLYISLHRGAGSFSIQRQYQKYFPVTLSLVSKGHAIAVKTNAALPVEIQANRCQLFFERGLNPEFSYKGSVKWEFFEIRISPSLLKELPASICPAWDYFIKEVAKNRAASLSDSNIYYRNTLKDITYALLNEEPAEPSLREKYLKVKVLEILLHVMQELLSPAETNAGITNRERILTSKTKRLLDRAQTSRAFTIQSLAKALDTNETTLKQSFKKVTGISIYQYYLHQRMMLAQQLLSDGLSVSGVALKVGYSNVSHFSHQFKKYFGTNAGNFKVRL